VGLSLALHALAGLLLMQWQLSSPQKGTERILVKLLPSDPVPPRKLLVEPQSDMQDERWLLRPPEVPRTEPSFKRSPVQEDSLQTRIPKLISSPTTPRCARRNRPTNVAPCSEGPASLDVSSSNKGGTHKGSTLNEEERRALEAYLAQVQEAIRRQVFYPQRARSNGTQGTVVLLVTLGNDGDLIDVEFLSLSGSRILDEAAMRAVQRSAPFLPCPISTYEEVQFSIPIVYRLEEA